ncbi:MAG: response regulator [Deltaproteobacteria bacterium]|nr:response regulator [Deltaproteobacteria bacterium]
MEGDKTILVIEDDEVNMKLVRTLLTMGNYQILEAVGAERGITIAREHKPDLILMDIQLSGMNGLSATQTIKADPATKGIPVIAITAFAMKGDKEKALDAGCAGYITKPIDTRGFLETIAQYLK